MKITAKKRSTLGKKVKSLRSEGFLPAILFGGNKESQPITLDRSEFKKIYQEAGEATLIDLEIGGKEDKVLISEVQYDPLGKLLHVDLQRIEAGEKLTATVPIVAEGESPAVKSGTGILLTLLDEIEVECLPQDLPSEIKVDISSLTEIGQGVEVKKLPIDKTKVKVLGHDHDELVLKIDYPEMEEEEEVVAEKEAVAAVETIEEKPEEEVQEKETEKKEEPSLKEGEKEGKKE